MMVIFPAIDILGGKAVRLLKGDYSQVTVYGDNPCDIARTFLARGCSAIHLVDLDGAREGSAVNLETVRKLASIEGFYSEIGGGIRTMETASMYLDAGISRVILGTAALNNPSFLKEAVRTFGDRVAVGVDMKDRKVAVNGWLETSTKDGLDFMKELEDIGVSAVIVTDISRDGALKGTNVALYGKVCAATKMKVTASGGVSTLDDIAALKKTGVYGAIIGKAYYSGALRLEDALEAAK